MNPKTTKTKRDPIQMIEGLSKRADEAVTARSKQKIAFTEEQRAEADIITLAVELARPALGLIVSRLDKRDTNTPPTTGVEVVSGLWLLGDGSFAEWPERRVLLRRDPVEVAAVWDPVDVVEGIADLLQRQIDGRGASAENANARTTKLRAIVSLMKEA